MLSAFTIMLNHYLLIVLLNVVMLSVVMLNVILLSILTPFHFSSYFIGKTVLL